MGASIQVFQNLENVNANNMNLFYQTTNELVAAFFINSPCIMNGIGNIANNYGQSGTSATFTFANGAVRFPDQPNVHSGVINYLTWAPYASGTSQTLTGITSGGGTFYCVAHLTQTVSDAYKLVNTMTILNAVVDASGLDDQNVALFAISNIGGVYSVFLDANCAYNYNALVTTGDLTAGTFNASIGSLLVNGLRTAGQGISAQGTNGIGSWIAFNNGYKLQRGFTIMSTGTGARQVTLNLPIAFTSGNNTIIGVDNGNSCYSYGLELLSLTQFRWYIPAGTIGGSTTVATSGVANLTFIAAGY